MIDQLLYLKKKKFEYFFGNFFLLKIKKKDTPKA